MTIGEKDRVTEHPYRDSDQAIEIPLKGGNVSTVVRIGETVRRTTGPWTQAIHSLLRYLERAGFQGAPHAFGIDARGREVLSFLQGDVYEYPMPDYVWSEETLAAVARLLRRYHDVVAAFHPPPNAVWQVQVGAPTESSMPIRGATPDEDT